MSRFGFLCLLILACQAKTQFIFQSGDVHITNAQIITVDDSFSVQNDMVIRDGNIVYVGPPILNESQVEYSVIDLDDQTILPGLIEAHTHPAASAGLYKWLDISGFSHDTAEQALQTIKHATENLPDGQWVLAFGWDAMLLKGSYPPYREVLDKISNKHPIWVMMQSMHSHYFNSYALDLANITDSIENPPGGGYYEKDASGKLTGLITETAPLLPFMKVLPKTSKAQAKAMMLDQFKLYNQNGITSIGITGLIDNLMPGAETVIQELSNGDKPNIRSFLYRIGGMDYSNRSELISNDFFQFQGYKYWADGSPYTGSMLLREPYEESDLTVKALSIPKGSRGHSMLPQQQMTQLVAHNMKQNHQISIHAQGDSACAYTLDVYKEVFDKTQKNDHRSRMEHLALVTSEQMKKMGQAGITPSFHINHIFYYGDFLARIVGEDRANQFMPLSFAQDQGMKFSLHNDSPMYPPSMFRAIQTAVERKTNNGRPIGLEYAISIEEAIRAVTIYPAWQMFAEDKIGSLEIGKKADFIIIDKNPLNIAIKDINSIKVLQTYVNGNKVH